MSCLTKQKTKELVWGRAARRQLNMTQGDHKRFWGKEQRPKIFRESHLKQQRDSKATAQNPP